MDVHLLFIGSPLLDVTLKRDADYLKKYNLKPDDCIRATEEHQALFAELLQDSEAVLQAGGSAQNSARVCKWVLGETGCVAFTGCVGKDQFADSMKEQLLKDKVEPIYAVHPTKPTGVCACLVGPNGERSMVTNHGAASTYDIGHLDSLPVRGYLDETNAVFIVGYFLAHSSDVFKAIARLCNEQNKLFAISLSAPYICRDYGNTLMEYMPFVDVVFGNYVEAKELVEKSVPDGQWNDPKECARIIAQFCMRKTNRKRVVVITNGTDPVIVCDSEGIPQEFPVPKFDNLVDTIGCGDALAGAFLATFTKTGSIPKSINSGILAARKIAERHGCTLPDEEFDH